MQKSIKKSLLVGSLALAMVLTATAGASAKSTKTTKTKATKTVAVKTTKTTKTAKTKVVKGHRRTLPGKVTAVTGTTVSFKKGNQTFTIEAAGVTPVNRKGTGIAITDIKVGHKISVRGTVAGTTVSNILKLRDITLPVSTTTAE